MNAKADTNKTIIAARVDVGFGNELYLRGSGFKDLSWDKGILMKNVSPYEWVWESNPLDTIIEYKLLINDKIWAEGENRFAHPNKISITSPIFNW